MEKLSSAEGGLLQVVYGFCYAKGLLNYVWFQSLFAHAYFFYKRYFEDIYHPLLKKYPTLIGKGHILDVGANIGYTTLLFAHKVQPGFKVHSFEPAPLNFQILEKQCASMPQIVLNAKAAGAASGNIELWINPNHHGDHRVITKSLESSRKDLLERVLVPLVSMDDYCLQHGIMEDISFVKIDVQGPEYSVLKGMEKLLAKNPGITLTLEYDTVVSKEMGEHPSLILDFLEQHGFTIYAVDPKGNLVSTTRDFFKDANIQAFANRAYVDIVATRGKNLL